MKWALAIIGVAVIALVAIGLSSGDESTSTGKAADVAQAEAQTGATTSSAEKSEASAGGSKAKSGSSSNPSGDTSNKAKPKNQSDSSKKSKPTNNGNGPVGVPPEQTYAATPSKLGASDVVSPILDEQKVRTVTANKGDVITLRAYSTSRADMEVKGYGLEFRLDGESVTKAKFKVTVAGTFEIEFNLPDGSSVKVGTLRVNP